MVGLTSYITRGHLARAVLEATGWQTREVVDAMNADSGVPVTRLKVDGGMTANHLLMQFVADVLDVPVERPLGSEAVSLGRGLRGGAGGRVLVRPRGAARQLAPRGRLGAGDGPRRCAAASATTGAARSTAATAGPPPRPPSSRESAASVSASRHLYQARVGTSYASAKYGTCAFGLSNVPTRVEYRGRVDRGIRDQGSGIRERGSGPVERAGGGKALGERGLEPRAQLAHRGGRVDVLDRAELAALAAARRPGPSPACVRGYQPSSTSLLPRREAVGDALDGQVEARHAASAAGDGVEQRAVLLAPAARPA